MPCCVVPPTAKDPEDASEGRPLRRHPHIQVGHSTTHKQGDGSHEGSGGDAKANACRHTAKGQIDMSYLVVAIQPGSSYTSLYTAIPKQQQQECTSVSCKWPPVIDICKSNTAVLHSIHCEGL